MNEGVSPAKQIRSAYARWLETRGGSAEDFIAMLSPEIVMRTVLGADVPDEMSLGMTGIDGARAYFASVARDWEMIDYPTEEIVAQGDTVVWIGRCHWRNRSSFAEVNSPKVDIWRFRDGKALEVLEMFDSLGFARAIRLV